jgi:hypothetical protein
VDGVQYRAANGCNDIEVIKGSPRFYHEYMLISRRSRYALLRTMDRCTDTQG